MSRISTTKLAYCTPPSEAILSLAANVKTAIFDVDGVLTDGTVYVGEDAKQMLAFHIHDGKGLRMLIEAGINVAWATARRGDAVLARAHELGVELVMDGCRNKAQAVHQIAAQFDHGPSSCSYLGDDIIDIAAIEVVGLGAAVADAHPQVISCAAWTTQHSGGRGAARELAELLLLAQNKLNY
ncbi:KdsC family phosphatase [Halorhodospira halochloris]|uniref:KdsC family phosphatase n=1 Tax=Halorhodospira halochloris TaxID=1052 RepID=UPI001EE86E2B|nr:HAD hydrolase family protein [Halorhodospira halochloris]MCG5548120.1 HAD hydrolase family protein [Halorhodospira halochloris]